jgi:hypothetical protein
VAHTENIADSIFPFPPSDQQFDFLLFLHLHLRQPQQQQQQQQLQLTTASATATATATATAIHSPLNQHQSTTSKRESTKEWAAPDPSLNLPQHRRPPLQVHR